MILSPRLEEIDRIAQPVIAAGAGISARQQIRQAAQIAFIDGAATHAGCRLGIDGHGEPSARKNSSCSLYLCARRH